MGIKKPRHHGNDDSVGRAASWQRAAAGSMETEVATDSFEAFDAATA